MPDQPRAMVSAIPIAGHYPRDSQGVVIANSVEVAEAARPRFDSPQSPNPLSDGYRVIVIVGAGYTGISAALRLAEAQAISDLPARIILLDSGRLGDGPSGKSAGHICGLQASPPAMARHCGVALADRLIAAASEAPALVRARIARHSIPCDLRDGYIYLDGDGNQQLQTGGPTFGIDPYPFVLGLAFAAREAGVEINEEIKVTDIVDDSDGCTLTTKAGRVIRAAYVIVTGGHQMAESIPLLRPLRARTTELKVSTIITDPLPNNVLRHIMPLAEGQRYPFANDASNVAYGSIDRHCRMIFGACAAVFHEPDLNAIARVMHAMFPDLADCYRAATGRPLRWRPLVVGEQLCFTRDALPNVGIIGSHQRVLYVHALGGHGLAIGTMLGEAAARKAWGLSCSDGRTDAIFDDFAAVRHGRVPQWQPVRKLTTSLGRALRTHLQHHVLLTA